MKEYTVVQKKELSDLIIIVNMFLAQKWKCIGGVTLSDGKFYQAMLR